VQQVIIPVAVDLCALVNIHMRPIHDAIDSTQQVPGNGCPDELKDVATPMPKFENVESDVPLNLTPSGNMDMLGRIAAANSQLSAFTASLDADSVKATVTALLAREVITCCV
jgi:hypothetical protein